MQKKLFFVLCIGVLLWGCKNKNQSVAEAEKPNTKKEDTTKVEKVEVDDFGIPVDSTGVEEYRVKRNESLYRILDKFNFTPAEIYTVTQQAQSIVDLKAMKPGQKYRAYASSDSSNSISQLVWQPNPIDYVVFDWAQDSLDIYKASRPLTSRTVTASGKINNSLFQTISEIGASQLLAHKMAEIFAWQINFFGLREGDKFKVLYNKRYIDGNFYGIGEVLAAKFMHRGETYQAYYFSNGEFEGYFDEKGNSVQKALLKAPFEFSQRISSRFSHNRYHPILKRRMPHHGVDYAAPYGTPVLAVGDGTVTEAQYRGANGNIIKITHNSTYRTAYLHLKGFASGIHSGARVEQGEIIGFVGNTGRSTGTHLDYRLYKNDRPVNPLSVELPSSESVPDSLMTEFRLVRDSLIDRMNNDLQQQPSITHRQEESVTMHSASKK